MSRQPNSFLFFILLLGPLPGCVALSQARPVTVLVQDAETKMPIPGAAVRLWYPTGAGAYPPRDAHGTADGAGLVRLQAVPYGDADVVLEGKANGYLEDESRVPVKAIAKIQPAHWFKSEDPHPAQFIVEIYAKPEPAIELVVPNLLCGLVKAKVIVRENVQMMKGQRCFSYMVPMSGTVEVEGPPILKHFKALDYQARFADGTPLKRDAGDSEVGFRWLKSEGGVDFFFIGTKAEADQEMRILSPSMALPESPAKSGKKGGGRGRGRGRQQADPATSDL